MTTPEKPDKPKTKRVSDVKRFGVTKDELEYLFIAVAAAHAASTASLQLQDLAMSQVTERTKPLSLLRDRLWAAIQEFSEGGE